MTSALIGIASVATLHRASVLIEIRAEDCGSGAGAGLHKAIAGPGQRYSTKITGAALPRSRLDHALICLSATKLIYYAIKKRSPAQIAMLLTQK